ncbi:TPA: hypothetical protein ACXE9F_004632 [Pluralibacter gergoviae]
MQTNERITWRNGFRLNGHPAAMGDIEPIFECRRTTALLWQQYEQRKAGLLEQDLSTDEYQAACRQIADELGI